MYVLCINLRVCVQSKGPMLPAEYLRVAIATHILDSSLADSDLLLSLPQDVDAILLAPLST
jgi:hypothetical protein